MAVRRLHSTVRREQIAEAGLEVVHAHGLKGLSMERLGRQVGLVPSAIYRHFTGKGEVLDAMLDLIHTGLQGLLAAANEEKGSPLEKMRDLLRRHLGIVTRFQAIPRILFSDLVWVGSPARKAKVHRIVTDYLEGVADLVRQAQQEGLVRPDADPQTVAVMFLGLFQPAVLLTFTSDGGFDTIRHLDLAWRVFLQGVQPAGQRQ